MLFTATELREQKKLIDKPSFCCCLLIQSQGKPLELVSPYAAA